MFQELVDITNQLNDLKNKSFVGRVVGIVSNSTVNVVEEGNVQSRFYTVTIAKSCTVAPQLGDLILVYTVRDFGFFCIAVF